MRLSALRRPSMGGGASSPTLVLLHGLGSDEHDLLGIVPDLDPALAVVSLRAPFETGYGGFAWFSIEFLPDGGILVDREQAESSLDTLFADVAELSAATAPAKLILGGFSQGAMMAAAALLARPDLVGAAWLMSGRSLPFLERRPELDLSRPVFVQHGTYDEVVPVEDGRALAEALAAHGHDARFAEYPMGHEISYHSLSDASVWLSGLVAES